MTTGSAIDLLRCIDTLEVGPVQVEPQRLIAPYTVTQNGQTSVNRLIYRYEEVVFKPAEWESRNLANMIAAQVALNYGLFCERIVFHGEFDAADQRFLAAMMENTSREIYVNKFVQGTPFLRGLPQPFPEERQQHYTRAVLEFPTADKHAAAPWLVNPERLLVLSSGGKDSLLSFGLLNELGLEAHPVFGNESGRHWFTAVNAYRNFQSRVAHTGRVWMNSDRLFSWMLRFLPFIRPDFATLRADVYPVRLWTVAVFLFGVLPLMRKRGLGSLVIGDEYDSTVRTRHHGITHYAGLYDQSRFFDEALSRYFQRKGWKILQFSMLRSLSELLILQVLVERYPDLQAQQVSCHAAHQQGERMYPCGKCEKCRRIVGMLKAFDADPQRCGYNEEQIRYCLSQLLGRGVKQDAPESNHLLWLLQQRGLLPADAKLKLRPYPEVQQLRFHPERSQIADIPQFLREPLYRLLLQHAAGALRKSGSTWQAFDLLAELPTRPG